MSTWAKGQHWRSWHRTVSTTRDGSIALRCGRLIRPSTIADMTNHLPVNERSCERCLQLDVLDQERQEIANDVVSE